MNTTTNYQLSQWEASDRVMRTDFNDNNAKIDAALKAISDLAEATSYRKLKDITTTATVQQVDIDMSDVDLNKYNKLDIYIHCSSASNLVYASLLVNGLTSGYMQSGNSVNQLTYMYMASDRDGYRGETCAEIFIGSAIAGRSCAANQQSGSDPSFPFNLLLPSTCAPSDVATLNLLAVGTGNVIGTGSRIEIYGVRR